MILTLLMFLGGLVGLYFGGEWLVRGAAEIARRFAVPPLVIGLTIVGFGTSTPELLVSVQAALMGQGGIAAGNVVGSNIANILLILGLSAAVTALAIPFAAVRNDAIWMVAAALVCLPVFWDLTVSRLEGGLLFLGILIYLGLALRRVGTHADSDDSPLPAAWVSAAFVLAGLIALMLGARLLVDSATEIARRLGVSEAIIGLTIVAVGTSLPELATSVTAAMRGQRDIAIGNVVGSNVFNIFAILGLTTLIAPIPVDARFLAVDTPVVVAVSLLLLALLATRAGVPRWAGFGFLAFYGGYVAAMAAR